MIQVQKFHSSFFSNFQNLPDALQFSKIPFLLFLFHSNFQNRPDALQFSKISFLFFLSHSTFQNRPNMPYNSQKFHSSSFPIPLSKIFQMPYNSQKFHFSSSFSIPISKIFQMPYNSQKFHSSSSFFIPKSPKSSFSKIVQICLIILKNSTPLLPFPFQFPKSYR